MAPYVAGDSGAGQKAETASQKAPGRDTTASQKASDSEAVTEAGSKVASDAGEYFLRASALSIHSA